MMQTPITVSQLNREVKTLLEQGVGEVFVAGELSNLTKPASGHLYFTMKDAMAQVRCVFFRGKHLAPHANLENGQKICVYGKLSLYEPRGDYQLIVDKLEEDGLGDLQRLFELLKNKLQAKGLFAAERKRAIPKFPNCIGVITSNSGAAIRDILATLERRFKCAKVLVYPSDVQGERAPQQLILALNKANIDSRADVLILARGGGSIEDLWAFNNEELAYSIANSEIPIVTGIGHEIDFTIADFVADKRAATPTAAAEVVTPDALELIAYFKKMEANLFGLLNKYLQKQALLLNFLFKKISSPQNLIASNYQKLDYLDVHLHTHMEKVVLLKKHNLRLLQSRLDTHNPRFVIRQMLLTVCQLEDKLKISMLEVWRRLQQYYKSLLATLNAVSPLATLDRGYALVLHNEKLITEEGDVNIGDKLDIKLAHGELRCEVISK